MIVDLAMQGSGLGGLDVIRRMRSHDPRTRILVFSMHSDPIIAARALEAGATGYVLKDTSSDELMKAFDQVRVGHALSRATISPCRWRWCARACGRIRSPTSRRANCRRCRCWREGKPYGRIAEELNVSYKTVVNACSQLKQKLNAKNLPELIRLAVQLVAAGS